MSVLWELEKTHERDRDEPEFCHVMTDWGSRVALCGRICKGVGTAHLGHKFDGGICEECGRQQCHTCLSLLPISSWRTKR